MNHPQFNPALEEHRRKTIVLNEKIRYAYPDFCACIDFMLYTGIRPSELWLLDEMELTMSGDLKFQPNKNNDFRIIKNPMALHVFNTKYANIHRFISIRSIQDLSRLFSKYFGHGIDFEHGKETILYIFRYMYINHLILEGYSKEKIRLAMGHRHIENTEKYLISISAAKYKE